MHFELSLFLERDELLRELPFDFLLLFAVKYGGRADFDTSQYEIGLSKIEFVTEIHKHNLLILGVEKRE